MKGIRDHNPPKLFLHFFRWFCHPRLKKPIEGDLMELHEERVKQIGTRKADVKFIRDVLLLFRPSIIKPADGTYRLTNYGMFKNYFKVGIRNILKYKMFSFINVFGLAVAMSVCMLIILMLVDQKSYDQFHEKKDRIYRVIGRSEVNSTPYATTAQPVVESIISDYPVVENAVSLRRGVGGDATYEQKTVELAGYFTDNSFFQVFDFPLVAGDKNSALTSPNTLVISKRKAELLFKDKNPIGQQVQFEDRKLSIMGFDGDAPPVDWGLYTVAGVVDLNEIKSHLKFDVLMSSSTLSTLYKDGLITDISQRWNAIYSTYAYLLLDEDADRTALNAALTDLSNRKYADNEKLVNYSYESQALTSITPGMILNNETTFQLPEIVYYILSLLAFVIMLMACLNYTNLSIARSLSRMKEIGVRKVNGASRKNLILQFLIESIVTVLIAMVMAVILLYFTKEAFMGLWTNQYLNFDLTSSPIVYLIFFAFALVVGVIAGTYPALFLSKHQPVKALRNNSGGSSGKWGIQKVLNVSQFSVSLIFIVTSMVIYNQFRHYTEFEYGFDTSNIINIPLQSNDHEKLLTAFSSVPGVSKISACQYIPATGTTDVISLTDANNEEESISLLHLRANDQFLSNLDLRILYGQDLPSTGNLKNSMVINESAATKLGYENVQDAIGKIWESKEYEVSKQIIGVVEDFRATLLVDGDKIRPMALSNEPTSFNFLNVKISEGNPLSTISQLEEAWKTVDPTHDFKYDFFDNELANTSLAIFDIVSIIGYLSFLAILIACLGLLGMATYTTERRTKEVGIRKVLGAEEMKLVLILSRGFLKLLLISVLIAAPLSYLVNNLWLDNLPNRVEFGVGTVLLGSLLLLVLGLITIGSQTIRASRRNPVESLKYE
ncbi:MAG: FtsX-like permease family protein [Cyclobacteriaceae bacterium]